MSIPGARENTWKGPKALAPLVSLQNNASVAETEQSRGRMLGEEIREAKKKPTVPSEIIGRTWASF